MSLIVIVRDLVVLQVQFVTLLESLGEEETKQDPILKHG
jgi:hypothetical protein